jgi:ADP-ribosylglycohydrolase
VPEAIICALEASSWEEAVRLAVSLGGDADTQAAIAGGIAGARWGVGDDREGVLGSLDNSLRTVTDTFCEKWCA